MLMVLVLLAEAPMHPYEMQRLMQWRGKDQVVRVQRGSLYPAVERLMRAGLIEPLETGREGRRPERTVYQTHRGGPRHRGDLADGTCCGTVRNEFPEFPAALSFIPIAVRRATPGLSQFTARVLGSARRSRRCGPLLADLREQYQLPRLFAIEDEYRLAMLEAEHRWVSRRPRRSGQRRTLLGPRARSRTGPRACAAGWDRSPASPERPAATGPAARKPARTTDSRWAGGVLRTHHRPGARHVAGAAPRQRRCPGTGREGRSPGCPSTVSTVQGDVPMSESIGRAMPRPTTRHRRPP